MHFLDAPNYSPLRPTDRKRLLALLNALGSEDASKRAKAALDASELVSAKGVAWPSIIAGGAPAGPSKAADDWKQKARCLLERDGLTMSERATIEKLLGWRAPGTEGLSRLREITGRIGATSLSF